jgi:fatty acid desaturase
VYLDPGLVEALRHVGYLHYVRLAIFLVLYLTTAYAAFWMAQENRGSAWVYVANIPLYLLAAASLHGISLFTHEGVHGTLSLRPWWNRALSIACAQPVLQNYSAYKVLHLKHPLYPTIPWYNLPRLHKALRDDLAARGAPFIKSYFEFVREFVGKSLRRSPLGKANPRG